MKFKNIIMKKIENIKTTIIPYHTEYKEKVIDLLRMNSPKYFALEEEADFSKYLDNKVEDYYILLINDKVVACGGVNYNHENTSAHISWDMVDPNYHGKGLGKILLKHRLKRIQSFPSVLTIRVRTSQLAYPFYEKMGFELIEVQKDYWAKGFDLYSMRLK